MGLGGHGPARLGNALGPLEGIHSLLKTMSFLHVVPMVPSGWYTAPRSYLGFPHHPPGWLPWLVLPFRYFDSSFEATRLKWMLEER
jgi:hypothetical protein